MANETINTPTPSMTTPVGSGIDQGTVDPQASPHTEEAKSRFNAALEEARAGAGALKDEAVMRAGNYKDQAVNKGENWTAEAKSKAGEVATEGKAKASGALQGLSRMVDENAARIDENFGPKYGDYARSASRSLRDTASSIERKSVEELGNDARVFVREQPGTAVGLAALAGFLIASVFRA